MPQQSIRALSYAVRPRIVLGYLGELCVVLAVLDAVPLAAALLLGDLHLAPRLAVCVGVLGSVGLGLRRLRTHEPVQVNEALVVTVLVFLVAPAVMAFALAAEGLAPLDAVFEAVSGVTTTGLSTVGSPASHSPTFLFTRAWLQWYGGLGIAVLCLALVVGPDAGTRRFGAALLESEDLASSLRGHARRILAVYVLLSGVGLVVVLLSGLDPLASLDHALAAVSTGGFSTRPDSLATLGPAAQTAILAVSVAGSISLPLYVLSRRRGVGVVIFDPETRALFVLGLSTALFVFFFESAAGRAATPALAGHAALQAFSAQSTTGFSSLRIEELGSASRLVLLLSMASGGSLGSTAGGIKLWRLLVVLRLGYWSIQRTRLPERAVAMPTLGGSRLGVEEMQASVALLGLFLGVVLLSWLAFLAFDHEPLNALFEVVSATGTVGLSTGLTGPDLQPLLKAVLCVDMIMGRLEIVAVIVTFSPRTWWGRRAR